MNFQVSNYWNQNLDTMKKIIQAVFAITLIVGMSSCSNAQNSRQMTEITTVELTSFKLIEGADEAKFIEAANQMQSTFLNEQEGFVKRTLVKGENGWTDIVYWKSPQAMQNAMKKAEASPEVAPFMQMINFEFVNMNLSEIKMNTN